MNKKITLFAVAFLVTSTSLFAGTKTVLIDFGQDGVGYSSPKPWVNVAFFKAFSISNVATDLLDENANKISGAQLKITDDFALGPNVANATWNTDGAAAWVIGEAARDNAYLHTEMWAEGAPGSESINATGAFELIGLDPSTTYSFEVFATRTGVSDIRSATYVISGADGSSEASLNASNNTSNTAIINDIYPTAQGVITFEVKKASTNTNSLGMFYLGAVKMTYQGPTGLNDTKENNNLKAIYKAGSIQLSDFTGIINIYDIAGKQIASPNAVFGSANVNLTKGIYIVKAGNACTKLIVN
jgi:hypothetical protein